MISIRFTGFVVLPLTVAVAGVSAARADAPRPGCCTAAASAAAQRVGLGDDHVAAIQAHTAIQAHRDPGHAASQGTFFDLD